MKTKTPNVSGRSAWLRDNITKYFSFSAIIILLVALSLTQDNFLGTSNLKNLLRDTAPLMIMSAGMTMVLLFGSIDLSMGAVCSVSNVTYIHLMLAFQDSFSNPLLTSLAAMAVSLAFGLASGLALGIIHVKLKVPSFIASLGFMSLWQSVALLITQNPESVPKALWGTVEWYKIAFGVVGLPLIVAIAIILFIHCVTRYTPSGRTIFAIGGNERTARVAGMGVDRTKILVFAINGVLAALAGIFLAANLRSSAPTIGDPFTLKIVAACALGGGDLGPLAHGLTADMGGTSLAGGKGSELGTILGVFTVAIIENGMNFIGVNAYYQNIVFGIFVLAAIALTVDRSIRGQIVK
jgi:ribose/xylose/arabinose/galactoside ABC-type transport system permease subunit